GVELNEKQKAKVEEIKASAQKKAQEVFEKVRDGKLQINDVRAEVEKVRDEMLKEMKGVLAKEQYEKFEKAVKEPRGPGGPGGFPGGPGSPAAIDAALRGIELDEKQRAKVQDIKAAQAKKLEEVFDKVREGKLDRGEMPAAL